MKKSYTTLIFLFSIWTIYCSGQQKISYSESLKSSIDKLMSNQKLTDQEILFLIPTTEDDFIEYISYYSEDKGKNINKVFDQIDNLVRDNTAENKRGFLKKYLELSVFVDGMYAELYYDHADFVISKNISKFCKLYANLSKVAKRNFEDKMKEYCK